MADRRPHPYRARYRKNSKTLADSSRLLRLKELLRDIPMSNPNFDKLENVIKLIKGAEQIMYRKTDPGLKAILNRYIEALIRYANNYLPQQ